MQQRNLNVAKSTTMTVRIPPEVSDMLDALARETKRSRAYLAGEAIADFVERNAWQVARIKHALDDARAGSPGVPQVEVEQWMESWDTDHELSRPEPQP
jgi:predicted transcriptional regulator